MARSPDPTVPWWCMVALALVLANKTPGLPEPWSPAGSRGGAGAQRVRRLQDEAEEERREESSPVVLLPPGKGQKVPRLSVDVPCWLRVHPCGNLTVPPEGLNITYPYHLGQYHIPGTDTIRGTLHQTEHAFSTFTVMFCCFAGVAYMIYDLWEWSEKKKVLDKKVVDPLGPDSQAEEKKLSRREFLMRNGRLEASDSEDEQHIQEDRFRRMHVDAADFVAFGNIYRLLAVLHPIPLVSKSRDFQMPKAPASFSAWWKIAGKAVICAYMQLYLPYKIIRGTLDEWAFSGAKSPLWFFDNGPIFLTMFASLGALCTQFQGKCVKNIRDGVEANFYILTHRCPMTQDEVEELQTYRTEAQDRAKEMPEETLKEKIASGAEGTERPGLLYQCGVLLLLAVVPSSFRRYVFRAWEDETIVDLRVKLEMQKVSNWCSSHFSCCTGQDEERQLRQEEEPLRQQEEQDPSLKILREFNITRQEQIDAAVVRDVLGTCQGAVGSAVRANALFWCFLSSSMNVGMSIMLQLCMFLKIATFTGRVEDVALVAVSLYFVFALDDKVMEGNDSLRKRYRRHVQRMGVLQPLRPAERGLMYFGHVWIWLSRFLTPLGLYGIVLFAWKNEATGEVIGGSGLD